MDPSTAQQLEVLELLERLESQTDEQKQEIQTLRSQLAEKDAKIDVLEQKVVKFEKLASKRFSVSAHNRPLPSQSVSSTSSGAPTKITVTSPHSNGGADSSPPNGTEEKQEEGISSGASQAEAKNALAALFGGGAPKKKRRPPPQPEATDSKERESLPIPGAPPSATESGGDDLESKIPDFGRWNKMKKMGIPPSHIKNKMVQEGVPANLIGLFLGESVLEVVRPKTVIDFSALGLREKRVIHTDVKMKRLHWEVIHPKLVANTIWKDVDDAKIQVEPAFQLQFQMRQPKPKTAHAQQTPRSASNEPHHFVSKKRSQQVQIGLRGMGLTPEEIRDAIVALDEDRLSSDKLMQLMDFAPTEDEQRQAEREAESVASARFGQCEKFFYQLYDLVELQIRLKLWLFKMEFRDIVLNLNDQMREVKKASDVLRNSKKFKILLSVILALGNTMNAGTRKGQAYGFQMTALSLLPNVKTINNQMTLLMYVYQFCRQHHPQALECITELSVLKQVSSLESEILQTTIERLFTEMDELTEAIDRWKRDYEDILDPRDRFIAVMEQFHVKASKEMNKLKMRTGLFNTSIKKLKKTFDWGTEDHDLPVEQLFRLIRDFMDHFARAEQDLINLEKERRKRKAKKEKLKKMKSRRAAGGGGSGPSPAMRGRHKAESDAEPNILEEIKLASQVKQAKFAALSRSISGHVRQRSRLINAKRNGNVLPDDIANDSHLQQVSQMYDRSLEQVRQYENIRSTNMQGRRSATANRIFDLDQVAQRRPPSRPPSQPSPHQPTPQRSNGYGGQPSRQPPGHTGPSPQQAKTFFPPGSAGSPPPSREPVRAHRRPGRQTPSDRGHQMSPPGSTKERGQSPRSPPGRALPNMPSRPLPGGPAQTPKHTRIIRRG